VNLNAWGEPSQKVKAYDKALADADEEMAKWLEQTYRARLEVAKLGKGWEAKWTTPRFSNSAVLKLILDGWWSLCTRRHPRRFVTT